MKKLFLLLACMFSFTLTFSQWQPTGGPCGGGVNDLVQKDNYLFTVAGDGVYRSSDNGMSWTRTSTGIAYPSSIRDLTVKGSKLFLNIQGVLYMSPDNGNSWSIIPLNGTAITYVSSLAANSQYLFAGSSEGIGLLRSADDGVTWQTMQPGVNIYTIHAGNGYVFAQSDNYDIYRSQDGGQTFDVITTPFYSYTAMAFLGQTIYVVTDGIINMSTDHGDTWTVSGIGFNYGYANILSVLGTSIYCGSVYANNSYYNYPGGLYVSSDNGNTWNSLGLLGNTVYSVVRGQNNRLIAATDPYNICLSDNNGASWNPVNNGLMRLNTASFGKTGNAFFAQTSKGVYNSFDEGTTWQLYNPVSPLQFSAFLADGNTTWAGGNSIFRSQDDGLTWQKLFTIGETVNVTSMAALNGKVYAGTNGLGIFVSPDQGETWTTANNGLDNLTINDMEVQGTDIFATTSMGIYRSPDNGATWVPKNGTMSVWQYYAIGADDVYLYTNGVAGFWTYDDAWISRSADKGDSWVKMLDFSGYNYITSFVVSGHRVIASLASGDNDIFYSDDDGETWSAGWQGLPPQIGIASMQLYGSTLYAAVTDPYSTGSHGSGIWKRALSDFIAFRLSDDTITLQPETGDSRYLGLTCGDVWQMEGTLPPWLTVDKTSGTGTDNIKFTAAQPNAFPVPRYTSVEFASRGFRRHLVIEQKEKIIGGIDEKSAGIRLYPNPTSGAFVVENITGYDRITVTNAMGKVVRDLPNDGTQVRINLSGEGKGIYLVRLAGRSGAAMREIVVW
jgi:photosystem II stability/assembly factor-like uncharacterized protein